MSYQYSTGSKLLLRAIRYAKYVIKSSSTLSPAYVLRQYSRKRYIASYEGWVSTQENELDLLNRADFERMFAEEKPSAFLAEHVWEHMTFDDGCIAAQNCYDFLSDGGYIRVAVPDANFRNEWYQGIVKVGGNGDPKHPAYTHKIVYDYKTLCAVFEKAGFVVDLLEYCDENGTFLYKYWNELDGKIGRSLRFDTRNKDGKLGMVSIIIDAKKPIVIGDK